MTSCNRRNDMKWKWPNGAQRDRDTHMCRNWNHRWRTSDHWWAESFDDENWVSTFLEYLEYQVE